MDEERTTDNRPPARPIPTVSNDSSGADHSSRASSADPGEGKPTPPWVGLLALIAIPVVLLAALVTSGATEQSAVPSDPSISDTKSPSPRATATTTPSPRATTTRSPSEAAACTIAFDANVDFVAVMNGLDSGSLSNASAAEAVASIERVLDATRKTISNPSFQSGMLNHANIMGLAKMSLLNNDLESFDLFVKEFLINGGYFTPHCR